MFKVGDKVRCIDDEDSNNTIWKPKYNLVKGRIYTVTELNAGTDIFVSGNDVSWRKTRFELVKEETMFKVGDKVKCVKPSQFFGDLVKDQIYTVIKIVEAADTTDNNVILEGILSPWMANRFELVKEEKPMFKAGDKVKVILPCAYLTVGNVYTVIPKHLNESYDTLVKPLFKLFGVDGRVYYWVADRFELFVEKEPTFHIVTKRPERNDLRWVTMDEANTMIADGKKVVIVNCNASLREVLIETFTPATVTHTQLTLAEMNEKVAVLGFQIN
jgi:hypothetical protein